LLVGDSSYQTESGLEHVIEVIAHLYGWAVLAAAAGSFATFFHFRRKERDGE
jgi:hypothetical protein